MREIGYAAATGGVASVCEVQRTDEKATVEGEFFHRHTLMLLFVLEGSLHVNWLSSGINSGKGNGVIVLRQYDSACLPPHTTYRVTATSKEQVRFLDIRMPACGNS